MRSVVNSMSGLPMKLINDPLRARHVLYCLAQDQRVWPFIEHFMCSESLISRVQAEDVFMDGFLPPDEWKMSEEASEALSDPPSSVVDQARIVVTEIPQTGNPSIGVIPTPPQAPRPLEVSVVIDWASSMTHVAQTDGGIRHIVNTDGVDRSSLSVTLPISYIQHPHPKRRPPIPTSIQTRPQPVHPGNSHLLQVIHADGSPSSPTLVPSQRDMVVDLMADEPWPSHHPSPRPATRSLRSEGAPANPDVGADMDEPTPYPTLPTPGEDMV